jgi:hypothetical protein
MFRRVSAAYIRASIRSTHERHKLVIVSFLLELVPEEGGAVLERRRDRWVNGVVTVRVRGSSLTGDWCLMNTIGVNRGCISANRFMVSGAIVVQLVDACLWVGKRGAGSC